MCSVASIYNENNKLKDFLANYGGLSSFAEVFQKSF